MAEIKKITQFKGHLAQIMWRADVKANIHVFTALFDQLRSTYTLTGPPVYSYTTPLPFFDMWTGLADDSDSQLSYWEMMIQIPNM